MVQDSRCFDLSCSKFPIMWSMNDPSRFCMGIKIWWMKPQNRYGLMIWYFDSFWSSNEIISQTGHLICGIHYWQSAELTTFIVSVFLLTFPSIWIAKQLNNCKLLLEKLSLKMSAVKKSLSDLKSIIAFLLSKYPDIRVISISTMDGSEIFSGWVLVTKLISFMFPQIEFKIT